MKKHIIIVLLISLALFSCHKIHEGNVTEKYIVPAHEYRYSTTMFVGKVPITSWHTGYVDDKYVLAVTNISGFDTITEEFSVSNITYECKSIGAYFNDTIPCEVYREK